MGEWAEGSVGEFLLVVTTYFPTVKLLTTSIRPVPTSAIVQLRGGHVMIGSGNRQVGIGICRLARRNSSVSHRVVFRKRCQSKRDCRQHGRVGSVGVPVPS